MLGHKVRSTKYHTAQLQWNILQQPDVWVRAHTQAVFHRRGTSVCMVVASHCADDF